MKKQPLLRVETDREIQRIINKPDEEILADPKSKGYADMAKSAYKAALQKTRQLQPVSDEAKCRGRACPKRGECLRYLRPGSEFQWYADFDLHQPCTEFLQVCAKESQ